MVMKLVYFDEAGDLGRLPKSPTPVYVGTFLYLKSADWKETFHEILNFRRDLKKDHHIPVREEFHTRNFILNKKPYTGINLSDEERIIVVKKFLAFIKKLGKE